MNEPRTEPYLQDAADSRPQPEVDPRPRPTRRRRHRARLVWMGMALIALLAIAAIVSILWQPGLRPETAVERTPASPSPAPAVAGDAEPRYPIGVEPGPQPPLETSDATLLAGLADIFTDGALSAYIEQSNVVRRIVVTVDNLPRRNAPPAHWPVKPAAGTFGTALENGRMVIAETNAFRYAPYVRLLESANTERLVELYRRHYPLFQKAYRELGFPDGNFNDRAVVAIDVLLTTPSLEGTPRLERPKIFVEYADRDLEQLPACQKLLLRMGPDNAARVKAKLIELRAAITDPALATPR